MAYKNSVIIPHYNDLDRLERCLAVLVQTPTDDTEIVVVDNNSTVEVTPASERFPAVRFIKELQAGAAHARNRGVREATGDNLFFLDCDCLPSEDWLATARRLGGSAPVIGGAIDVFDETQGPRTGAQAFETVFAFNYRDYILNKGFSVTANLLTTRVVFNEVGDFIHGLSEDAEWCLRARDKGFGVVLSEELRVAHPTRSDWTALERKWRRISREMFALHLTNAAPARRLRWSLRAMLMAASIPVHLPKVLLSRRLETTSERMRGAGTLIRLRALRAGWMLRQAMGHPI